MNPITAYIEPYKLVIELGIAALLIGALAYQHHRIGALKTERENQRTTINNYASANQSNVKAIGLLTDANDAWKSRGLDAQASANAVASLTIERDHLATELHNRQTNREIIYASQPSARQWADTGMPARLADALWLQQRASARPH